MAAHTNEQPDAEKQTPRGPTVVLLSDEPSDVDEFEAKAHDQVARSIAELVASEPGGKVIGLEGTWGSGKSTVVRLVSKNLVERESVRDSSEIRAVIFDAWAHQDDPLRRSFLETVIHELVDAKWFSQDDADECLALLSGKTSKVHTRTTARLSFEGKLTSAAAALLPLGAVLASNSFKHYHRPALYVGVALLLGPLLVVLGLYVAKKIASRNLPSNAGTWRRKFAELRPSGFFANEQETDTTTDEIESGNPTSVEFERLFSRVLDASLSDSRRLLVVLDNLDRVDEVDAKQILATMQTFTSSGSNKPWTKRLWTLIPYDPAGLDRIWNPEASGEDEPQAQGQSAPLTSPTAAAFIEKVFQVRFTAPPLVLSDWRGYLLRLLGQAIPDEQDDFPSLLRLRALYPSAEPEGLVAKEAPTPRQLKQFVNQIGSVRRQRSDIPLTHVAYYTLLRRDRVNVAARLIANSLPHPNLSQLFTAEIQADLAALHFGTTQSLAQQLLLGGALESAFAGNDSSAVASLKERAGFVDALDSLDLGSRAVDGGVELTRAVAVLNEAGAFEVAAVAAWSTSALLPQVRATDPWILSGAETGTGLAFLFDGLSRGDDAALAQLLSRLEPASRDADADGHLQLAGAAALANGLVDRGRTADTLRIRLEIPSERLASSLAFFAAQTPAKLGRAMLELAQTPAEVGQALVPAATNGAYAEVAPALDVLLSRPEPLDLEVLASGCLAWLGTTDPGSADHLKVLLELVDRARRTGSPEDVLGPAADNGILMHLVSIANTNGWYAEAAAASMLHLVVRPALPEPQAVREAPTGIQLIRGSLLDSSVNPNIVASQLEWLEQHSNEAYALVMRIAAAEQTFRPWVSSQLNGLWSAAKLVISAEQYLLNWKYLRGVLTGDRFPSLTRSLLKDKKKRAAIIAGSTEPALAAAAFEVSNSESGESYAAEVRAWGSNVLMATSAADWQTELAAEAGGPLVDLALGLAGTPEAPSDPPGLFDALHTHFQALASSEAVWQPTETDFAKLTSLLGAPARKALAGELGAALEGRDGQVGPGLFPTYGTFLARQRDFRTHKKLPGFVARAMAHDDWASVKWFVDLAHAHSDTLQTKSREDELEHLRQQVGEKLAGAGDNPPESLSELSILLKEKQ